MQTRSYKPNPRYLIKLRIGITVVAMLSVAGTLFLGLIIPEREATIIFGLFGVAGIVAWVVALILAGPYYSSLGYEIEDDEEIDRSPAIAVLPLVRREQINKGAYRFRE